MKQQIPLNALVVLIGPSGGGKSTFAEQFAPMEVVSTDKLRLEYLGDARRIDMDDVIYNEFDRRIRNRLELGLRVVADATHIRNTARRRTVKLAEQYGTKVIYVVINRPLETKLLLKHAGWRADVVVDGKPLIIAHEDTFLGNEASILCGDGGRVRTVIDTRKEVPQIVMPLSRGAHPAPLDDLVSRGYKGVLVVGDVHGNIAGLKKMRKFARQNELFLLYLGDIVDYGTDTLVAADIVAHDVFNGFGVSVMGNHEKKILRWVTKERVDGLFGNEAGFTNNLSEGNLPTVNQIKAMMPKDRLAWETKFIGFCATMPHFIRLGQYFFTHGAASPAMFDATDFRFPPRSEEESLAMFGESNGEYINGFPVRLYGWVDLIPPRMTVVVGHDCRCDSVPFVQAGSAGGRAIFLDTGSSKPERFAHGHLTGMSLEIAHRKKIRYVLENERFHSELDM